MNPAQMICLHVYVFLVYSFKMSPLQGSTVIVRVFSTLDFDTDAAMWIETI